MFTLLLALIVFCLGLFFLSLFFQLSRLEIPLHSWVRRLEKRLMIQYGLSEQAGLGDGEE